MSSEAFQRCPLASVPILDESLVLTTWKDDMGIISFVPRGTNV